MAGTTYRGQLEPRSGKGEALFSYMKIGTFPRNAAAYIDSYRVNSRPR